MPLSEGTISYQTKGQTISPADIYTQIGLSAPYLELPEEYTLTEFLQFHFRFKQLMPSLGVKETIQLMYLEPASNKPISLFSSGMKQRLKLGICLFSSSPLLLLDEPTSNLDARGIAWYLEMINTYGADKTLIICSNDEREFSFCNRRLAIEEYK